VFKAYKSGSVDFRIGVTPAALASVQFLYLTGAGLVEVGDALGVGVGLTTSVGVGDGVGVAIGVSETVGDGDGSSGRLTCD